MFTQYYSFHCFTSPTSQQQLYPQVSQSAAKNCCQSKAHSHLQISKRHKYEAGCFGQVQHFLESWLVPLMSAAHCCYMNSSCLIFYMTTMHLIMKDQISQEDFAILVSFKKIMILHWHSCTARVTLQPSAFHCSARFEGEKNQTWHWVCWLQQDTSERSAETGRACQRVKKFLFYKTPI